MPPLGLDLESGAQLARSEIYGDWFRDPWGWPEISPAFVENLTALDDLGLHNESGEYHLGWSPHFSLIEVPKTGLGLRPAVVQDPLSRLAYLSAVHSGLSALHRDLPAWAYGWRLRGQDGLRANDEEWKAYVDDLPTNEATDYGLTTDITSFFASIDPELLRPILYSRLGRVAATTVIMDVLRAHDNLATRSGLPQRSFASAALAHCVVQPIDDVLASAPSGVRRVRRWMDDISAEGDEGDLFALLIRLQETVRHVGLELNAAKTSLRPASDTAGSLRLETLREIPIPVEVLTNHYTGETTEEADPSAVFELERYILGSDARGIPRTVIRATLNSLTKNGFFGECRGWMDSAHQLPHAADTLSRFLRAAAESQAISWDDLGRWFLEYQRSQWGGLQWVTSQLALAFPTTNVTDGVARLMHEWLETSADLQKVSIAQHRLSVLNPTLCRTIIRGRLDHTSDPLLLRTFGLGLLATGDNRSTVQSVFDRDPRNSLIAKYLEERHWQPPAIVKDFDSPTVDNGTTA